MPIRDCIDFPGPDVLDTLVFGAWDNVSTDAHAAARLAGVLEPDLLDSFAPELSAIRSWAGIFNPRFNHRPDTSFFKAGRDFLDLAHQVQRDIKAFEREHGVDRSVFLWCWSTETVPQPCPRT